MNGMPNMYGQTYPGLEPQMSMDGYPQDIPMEGLDNSMMAHGSTQTLDQIINQNNQELMRRRQTTHQPQFRSNSHGGHDQNRRASMLEFGTSNNGELTDFEFDPAPRIAPMPNQFTNIGGMPQKGLDPRRVRSREDLSLDTRFSQMPNFENGSMSAYPASMLPNTTMGMDGTNSYLPQDMGMGNDYDNMAANMGASNMSSGQAQQGMYTTSPIAANFAMQYPDIGHDPGGPKADLVNNNMMRMHQGVTSNASPPQRFLGKSQNQIRRNPMMPSPLSMSAQNSISSTMASPAQMVSTPTVAQNQQPPSRRTSTDMQSQFTNQPSDKMPMDPSRMAPQPAPSKWANAYSSTGFDMLAILMRVATRNNPQINIGPVDLSCAFVVCDCQKHDMPIVYCSDMFERLTGYSRHEILGRNCRFLQAPDGQVQSGIKRKYVDDKSVLYLKNQIIKRAEAQLSLINYRKGGQPFMNLLTMIPITWDTEEYKYFVGFQVDLVEQPNSVSAKNPDGTYEINYNRSALPAYRLPAPDPSSGLENMGGQTIPRDEVSQVLATIGSGETDLSRRIWDKVLLENTDDVVHVLSLKGLFLYLSPGCKSMLEYDPSELVGTALSAVCHPSDIVPVTRELKDTTNGSPVNVVYRIRRKKSGYTWFEAHGSLHTEQGKGRKCIILVGRQRPVFALARNEITLAEGAGDAELWTKMSTTGMFLYVSSTSRSMLDRIPDDLIGSSMQMLMRPESRKEFGRVLELARLGEKSTFKHDLQNRRGQVLQAQTTVYPGDAKKGLKPTFLLGQTRLLKMTRAMLLHNKSNTSIARSDASLGMGTPMSNPQSIAPNEPQRQTSQPVGMAASSGQQEAFVGGSGILTMAGSGGVPIGSQDEALASEENIFDELKTTRSTSWQFELRQMERQNRLLAEDLQTLLQRKKKRKRRKGMTNLEKDCANCHTRVTPEWRRGPSGQRDLCNSCGLRWAKQNGRVSPRKSEKSSTSPVYTSTAQPRSTSNPTGGSKEPSAETKMTSESPADEDSHTPTQLGQSQIKREREDDNETSNMPTILEEGSEPQPNVLPT
ncbi:hypothetical protein PMZ80_005034 [Knufia obscura]|uniref:White collar 1 protein n=1 Tax=Knufia obscura TaxID=1635080 RepID=A0ABR0RQG9_9EURO|nr:hypothetical protein PMZ80_005034 [Knufia obscura]